MTNSSRSLDSLHYLDSWNKHCGGSWTELVSRSITLTDSIILAYAGIQVNRASKLFGKSFGTSLISKSANDIYESWTGNRGIVRNSIGDEAYLAVDIALIGYGFFKHVRKINYLGNPAHDFFVKDPISYEYAFKQFTTLELINLTFSTSMTVYSNRETLASRTSIEDAWQKHLHRMGRYD
jgi:hypothetical protein